MEDFEARFEKIIEKLIARGLYSETETEIFKYPVVVGLQEGKPVISPAASQEDAERVTIENFDVNTSKVVWSKYPRRTIGSLVGGQRKR